eukprot:2669629-Amphidinium_carterae.1
MASQLGAKPPQQPTLVQREDPCVGSLCKTLCKPQAISLRDRWVSGNASWTPPTLRSGISGSGEAPIFCAASPTRPGEPQCRPENCDWKR